MKKKLSKYGNSLFLLIDKPILELLHINETTELEISTDGKNIVISPAGQKQLKITNNTELQKLHEELIEKYRDAFEKLSRS
ncbi:MAG TPA: AbrB/MazE/SpoVT family DNA-binding domain-containing protein [Candidatus Bathyarchaeia archaeon]|nr:AbrB/MazE/SpoVT family DNA-binding domain-containing protein [Candidatus Bathyarchaeia archaeon]